MNYTFEHQHIFSHTSEPTTMSFFPPDIPQRDAVVYRYYPITSEEYLNDFVTSVFAPCSLFHRSGPDGLTFRGYISMFANQSLDQKIAILGLEDDDISLLDVAIEFAKIVVKRKEGMFKIKNYNFEYGVADETISEAKVDYIIVRYYKKIPAGEMSRWVGWCNDYDEFIEE